MEVNDQVPKMNPPDMSSEKDTRLTAIERDAADAAALLGRLARHSGISQPTGENWEQTCHLIQEQLSSGYVKIGVAGSIKSGKSTLINAMLGKDLVRRGAGVVTAITTRIRKGPKNHAQIFLKSWDDVNDDLRNALVFFPDSGFMETVDVDRLDIRKKNDRQFFKDCINRLSGMTGAGGRIRSAVLMLQHAVHGYSRIKDLVQADETVLEFTGREFRRHQEFSADLSMAFFVRDIQLSIAGSQWTSHVEIADCQGTDSIDPGQIMHVQRYLESAHLIFYVISSRTGLRQADMEFLSLLKSLGISKNILFVINVDLSEHKDLADLKRVVHTIESELSFLVNGPGIYPFSCLYALFDKMANRLPAKDKKRLAMWQDDRHLTGYSEQNADAFFQDVAGQLEKDYLRLIAVHPRTRLVRVLKSALRSAELYSDMLSEDTERSSKALEEITRINDNAKKIEAIVEQSLDTAVQGILEKIKTDCSDFFLKKTDTGILFSALTFVENYAFDLDGCAAAARRSGIPAAVYEMVQDFRSEFDLFAARQVFPLVTAFVNDMENMLHLFFQSMFQSYQIELPPLARLSETQEPFAGHVDITGIKDLLGFELPDMKLNLRFSAAMKLSAFTGFGFQALVDLAAALLGKPGPGKPLDPHRPGLNRTVRAIKAQAAGLLPELMDTYKNQVLDQFLVPLTRAAFREFRNQVALGYHRVEEQKNRFETDIQNSQKIKNKKKASLDSMSNEIRTILENLEARSA